jgi:hypothetical protein
MRFRTEFAVWAVLLVALAANPVWFFPHLDDDEVRTYRTVEITDENRYRYVEYHSKVLECNVEYGRACGFEVAALHGVVVVDTNETLYSESRAYDYVGFPTGYYRPTLVETSNGTRLTLERVTVNEILADFSYSYTDASERARKVVRDGRATFRWEIREDLVRRNGTYYALRTVDREDRPLGGWVPRYRWLMWLGTVPLSVAAMWRWT